MLSVNKKRIIPFFFHTMNFDGDHTLSSKISASILPIFLPFVKRMRSVISKTAKFQKIHHFLCFYAYFSSKNGIFYYFKKFLKNPCPQKNKGIDTSEYLFKNRIFEYFSLIFNQKTYKFLILDLFSEHFPKIL